MIYDLRPAAWISAERGNSIAVRTNAVSKTGLASLAWVCGTIRRSEECRWLESSKSTVDLHLMYNGITTMHAYMHVQLARMANCIAASMHMFTFTTQPMFLLQVERVPAILHLHPLCLVWLLPALRIRQTCALPGAAFASHCTGI